MKVLNIIRKEVVRVDDDEIVELFLKKDESAIIHTAESMVADYVRFRNELLQIF